MTPFLTLGVAVVLAGAMLPQASFTAKAAEKGVGVTYQMFRPDGTPVRSKSQKGSGQNEMRLEDASGKTKSVSPRKLKAK